MELFGQLLRSCLERQTRGIKCLRFFSPWRSCRRSPKVRAEPPPTSMQLCKLRSFQELVATVSTRSCPGLQRNWVHLSRGCTQIMSRSRHGISPNECPGPSTACQTLLALNGIPCSGCCLQDVCLKFRTLLPLTSVYLYLYLYL